MGEELEKVCSEPLGGTSMMMSELSPMPCKQTSSALPALGPGEPRGGRVILCWSWCCPSSALSLKTARSEQRDVHWLRTHRKHVRQLVTPLQECHEKVSGTSITTVQKVKHGARCKPEVREPLCKSLEFVGGRRERPEDGALCDGRGPAPTRPTAHVCGDSPASS